MTSRTVIVVRQPREHLQAVLVERTWELAQFLDEIEAAELREMDSSDAEAQSAIHAWRAKANVPALLAPHMDADYFGWTAMVAWSADNFSSRWRIEPHALKDSLSCAADVTLTEALGGRATRVHIDADIRGLAGRQGAETIAYRVLLVNWQKLVAAAARKLDTEQLAGKQAD